jgi:hypothetical protein
MAPVSRAQAKRKKARLSCSQSLALPNSSAAPPGYPRYPLSTRCEVRGELVEGKGDISDWIAAGGAAERLIELVEAVQDWGPPRAPPAEARQSDGHSSVIPDFWPKIDEAAYSGLVGDIVRTILPHTEADAVALLIQTLVMAGRNWPVAPLSG